MCLCVIFGGIISTQGGRSFLWTLLLEKAFVIFLAGRFFQRKKYKAMLGGEESLISEDSMPSLIGGDKDNLFDVEPHMQADHVGLARDAYRRQ